MERAQQESWRDALGAAPVVVLLLVGVGMLVEGVFAPLLAGVKMAMFGF